MTTVRIDPGDYERKKLIKGDLSPFAFYVGNLEADGQVTATDIDEHMDEDDILEEETPEPPKFEDPDVLVYVNDKAYIKTPTNKLTDGVDVCSK